MNTNPDNLDRLFAAAVADGLKKIEAGRRRLTEAEDLEGVHLMRTALRRLRTAFRCLGSPLDAEARKTLRANLKEFMSVLSPVRDLDVLAQAVNAMQEMTPEDRADLISATRAPLDEAIGRMCDYLSSPACERLLSRLSELTQSTSEGRRSATAAPKRVMQALERVLEAQPDDFTSAPETSLHDLRKNVKRLRYAMELFQPEYGRPVSRAIERCRALQEALGRIQDAAAFATFLRGTRTFAAGQFLASIRAHAASVRRDLPALWQRALGPKALARLGAHLLRRAARGPSSETSGEPLRAVS